MAERVGLIQAGGIGDCIIALPIADHFLERGSEVVWPINVEFCDAFRAASPKVTFIPVTKADPGVVYDTPMRICKEQACNPIHCLYSFVAGRKVHDEKLFYSLKFDEYKYAVAGVPFARKWDLR